ncbi:hypothetical protein CBDKU1_34300 [Clostridium butyricum DKU-01]|nr:hypothetical protein CBDKU1_34300 [Clostridium butyricum DKU-01]
MCTPLSEIFTKGCASFGKNKSKIEAGNLSIEQYKERLD